MFDDTLISEGYKPLFALIEESITDIVILNLQLKFFNNRVENTNIKTQFLESDDSNYLLILYVKDKNDDESMAFILDNLVDGDNLIHADAIKIKNN